MNQHDRATKNFSQNTRELAQFLPIIVFDGDCGLCNRLAGWILSHQPLTQEEPIFVVGGESPFGKALLEHLQLEKLAESTILFVTEEGVLTRMDASYAIWRRLRAPWSWLPFLYGWLPRSWLNFAYDQLARRRKRAVCSLNDMKWRQEFAPYILDERPFPKL